jgi:hypothetical protein
MCPQTVTIHASTAEASLIGDGLFGTLGDSPIALVDPIKDWKGIEKARVLWQTFCQTDADAASFFGQAAKLQDRVRKWSNSAKLAWLYFRWCDEAEQRAPLSVGDKFTPTLSSRAMSIWRSTWAQAITLGPPKTSNRCPGSSPSSCSAHVRQSAASRSRTPAN